MTNRKYRKRMSILADALYNTHKESGASVDYAKGIVVGAASALMAAEEISLKEAVEIIYVHLPAGYRIDSIPESWLQ